MPNEKIVRRGCLGPLPKYDFKNGKPYDWTGRNVSGIRDDDDPDKPGVPIAYLAASQGKPIRVPFTVVNGPEGIVDKLSADDLKFWKKLQCNQTTGPAFEHKPLQEGFPGRRNPDTDEMEPIPPEQYVGGVVFIVQKYKKDVTTKYFQLKFGPDIHVPLPDCTEEQGCGPAIEGVTEPPNPGFTLRTDWDSAELVPKPDPEEEKKKDKDDLSMNMGRFIAVKIYAWCNPDDVKSKDDLKGKDIKEAVLCYCNQVAEIGSRTIPTGALEVIGNTAKIDKLTADAIKTIYGDLPGTVAAEFKPDDDVLIQEIMSFFREQDGKLKANNET